MVIVRLFVLLVCALMSMRALPHAQGDGAAAGTRTIELTFQGRVRRYLLHVPPSPAGPLALVFHGGGQVPAQIQQISGFDAIADRERFIVAYPEAVERSWADGRNETSAEKQGVDDVGFAKAVVEDIARRHPVDRSRVFAAGLSNGAVLSHRLGCDAAEVFAAIAPVAGLMATRTAASCRPSMPVAVVGVYGRDDPSVLFDGDVGGNRDGAQLLGSRATEERWRLLNGCAAEPATTSLPVLVKDGTVVERRSFANCRGTGDVVTYEIRGGGHRWPPHTFVGPAEALSLQENGVSSANINATETMWAFFAAHARRGPRPGSSP